MNISDTVSQLQKTFNSGRTKPLRWRLTQLTAVQRMLKENQAAWERALHADLGKHASEAWLTEISPTLNEAAYLQKHLARWIRPTKARTPLSLQPARSRIRHEPLGTVLIIAPWNYPLHLILMPLLGALAGGNCAVLKPSELAPHTAQLLSKLAPRYLDSGAVKVVTGGAETVHELLEAAPNKVFFTGSARVGKILAAKCAAKLIPIELELGGKSPVYVHYDADLRVAAKRIVWGKLLNAGQTCVAPDHVYVHQRVAAKFSRMVVQEMRRAARKPQSNPYFGRIITVQHATRLAGLLNSGAGGQVLYGGTAKPQQRFVCPTVLYNVPETHPAMREEIFGPILPILPVSDWQQAAANINKRPQPLAAYVFTASKRIAAQVSAAIPSGSIAVNATVIQISNQYLPFGGVGASGWGHYHGKWSFTAFTQQRAEVAKLTRPDTLRLIYTPIRPTTRALLRLLLKLG